MKKCRRCTEIFDSKQTGANAGMCAACTREYNNNWRAKNPDKHLKKVQKWNNKNRILNKRKVAEYLKNHPCVACGENDIIVLEFDHREPKDKLFTIGANMDYKTWDRIKQEITKCDVLCANCHRKRTYHQYERTHRTWE